RKHTPLREGYFLIVQGAILEMDDHVAFDKIFIFQDLGELPLANCLPGKRAHDEIAMGHALQKPHRDRSGVCRRVNEECYQYEDRHHGGAGCTIAHSDFQAKPDTEYTISLGINSVKPAKRFSGHGVRRGDEEPLSLDGLWYNRFQTTRSQLPPEFVPDSSSFSVRCLAWWASATFPRPP